MHLIELIIICIGLLAISTTNAQDIDKTQDSAYYPVKLESAIDAISRTLELTGFEDYMKTRLSMANADEFAKKIGIRKQSTIYPYKLVEGQELWEVRLNDVDIRTQFARENNHDIWKRKSFIVILDPNTGQAYEIYSLPLSEDLICTLELSSAHSSEFFKRREGEFYGFPLIPPKVTLLEALNAAAGCTPLVANEIIAQYILYSRTGAKPVPVWSITSLGKPPTFLTSMREKHSIGSIGMDCMTCIVDATSGNWVTMTNVPCNTPKDK